MGKLELVVETEKVSIYSPKLDGESDNEFRRFLLANKSHEHQQLKISFDAILSAVDKISEDGALERFFRSEGGNIKAIPLLAPLSRVVRDIGKMRLYCLRLSDRLLIIGNGVVTTAQKNKDDPAILSIIKDLRNIERHIERIASQANADYDDFDSLKHIIETVTF